MVLSNDVAACLALSIAIEVSLVKQAYSNYKFAQQRSVVITLHLYCTIWSEVENEGWIAASRLFSDLVCPFKWVLNLQKRSKTFDVRMNLLESASFKWKLCSLASVLVVGLPSFSKLIFEYHLNSSLIRFPLFGQAISI